MDILIGILIGAALLLLVLFLLGRRALRSLAKVDPTQFTFDAAVMEETRALAAGGKKIQAIAYLREHTPGLPLATAKSVVDRLELQSRRPRTSAAGPDRSPSRAQLPLETELEVRALLADGRRAEAIDVVRSSTGLDAAAAAGVIDSL